MLQRRLFQTTRTGPCTQLTPSRSCSRKAAVVLSSLSSWTWLRLCDATTSLKPSLRLTWHHVWTLCKLRRLLLMKWCVMRECLNLANLFCFALGYRFIRCELSCWWICAGMLTRMILPRSSCSNQRQNPSSGGGTTTAQLIARSDIWLDYQNSCSINNCVHLSISTILHSNWLPFGCAVPYDFVPYIMLRLVRCLNKWCT